MLAVDDLGKDLCAGGFTRSARAAKQIGMAERVVLRLITQNGCDVLLSANIVKGLWTPLSVKCLMHRDPSLVNSYRQSAN
jgi:hypothetical protein